MQHDNGDPHEQHARTDRAIAWAACIVSAALLLWLCAPSAAARDGAELTAAGASLGIAHPTGFALELVAWRVAMLAPLGDLAFRGNAVTALFGAVSIGLATWLALAWMRAVDPASTRARRVLCALVPVAVVSSQTLLRGFTAIEVYASSLALSLALVSIAHRSHAALSLRAVALLAGLSFVTHTTARAAVIATFIALVASDPRARRWRARSLVAWSAMAFVALALVAYLPIAARREPWADWGGPVDARGLWAHLSASRIRQAFSSQMGLSGSLSDALSAIGRVLVSDLGWLTLAMAFVGLVLALRDRRAISVSIALCAAFDLAYTALVNPMGTRDRQTLFLFEVAAILLAVRALFALVRRAQQQSHRVAASVVVATLFGAFSLTRLRLDYAGSREGWSAVELYGGPGALGALAPRAVVLCESDEMCGGSLFARVCEGDRPDVVVMPRQHLWDRTTWRRLRVALGHPPADRSQPRTADEALRVRRMRAVLGVFGERVRWEQGDRLDERLTHITLSPSESPVLAAPVLANQDVPTEESLAEVSRWIAARDSSGVLARRMAATILFSAGMRASRQSLARAAPFWQAALVRDPDHAGALTNLGVAFAQEGRVREAIVLTERSIAVDPSRAVAWQNLARFCASLGDVSCVESARARAAARRVNLPPPARVESGEPARSTP